MNSAALATVIAVGFSACVQIFTDPRITKAFVWKSLLALAVYLLHVAIGMVVMLFLLPWNRNAPVAGTTAILAWIVLGGLGLVRFAPRSSEPPRWLLHFGVADPLCLAAMAWGVATYAGLL